MIKFIYSCIALCFQFIVVVFPIIVNASIETDVAKLVVFLSADDEDIHAKEITDIIDKHISLNKDTREEQDYFLAISNYFYDEALYKEGLQYFKLLNDKIKEQGELKGIIYYHLGRFYNAHNNKKNAEESLNNSLELLCDSPYLYRIYSGLMELHTMTHQFKLAEEYAVLSLKLCDQYYATNKEYFRVYKLMTLIYSNLKDFEKMDYCIQKIRFYANKIQTRTYFNDEKLILSVYHLSKGRLSKGIEQLDKIISIQDESNAMIHQYYYIKGLSYMNSGNYNEAIKTFKQGLQITKGVKPHAIAMTYTWLGNSYEICKSDQAIIAKNKAIDIYIDNSEMFSKYIYENYSYIGSLFRLIGDFQNAHKNYLLANKYAQGDLERMIFNNGDFILLYGELLKEEFSENNLDALFTIMNETHEYILEWNFNRHYIDNDTYREKPIRMFYEDCLEVLQYLYQYTGNPLIASRIISYSNSLQSLIYNNNKVKFDPFLEGTDSNEFEKYKKSIQGKIFELRKKSTNRDEYNMGVESIISNLDSIELLKEEYKQFVMSNSLFAVEEFSSWQMSNAFIKDVQKNIRPEEVMVTYYCSIRQKANRYLYSTVISKSDISFFSKKITPAILESIKSYRQVLTQPILVNKVCFEESKIDYFKTSNELYQFLLKEELESLKKEPDHIFIVADNLVQALPFNALLTDKMQHGDRFKDAPFLISKYSVSYDYSLQSFLNQKKKKRKTRLNTYVGFSPEYDDSSSESVDIASTGSKSNLDYFVLRGGIVNLPAAKQGVISISEQLESGVALIGENATKESFKKSFGTSDIIHFAGHAVIDNDKPELSQFLFSGSNENLNLHAYELFDLNIDTELAMLSACDTGTGKVRSGMSMQSISQAFSFAGASSLTMSFYKIPDAQTALIDKYFIEKVYEGVRLDKALQQSNLIYLKQSTEKFAHPFYWAGIALSGKTEPLIKSKLSLLQRLFM